VLLAAIGQNVDNDATTVQDSSADDNELTNDNEFGDDVAVVDQDNDAEQDALNLGFQDQDADIDQDATQSDDDINFQYGFQTQGGFGEENNGGPSRPDRPDRN
jgi:hypothetical protein